MARKPSAFEIASKLAHDRAIYADTRAIPLDDFGPPPKSYVAEPKDTHPKKRKLTPRRKPAADELIRA